MGVSLILRRGLAFADQYAPILRQTSDIGRLIFEEIQR